MTDSTLSWITAFAAIVTALAAIAVPLVVASIGAKIQSDIAEQGNRTTYVMLAVQTLSVRETEEKDERLRAWAVDVFNEFSPVPLGEDVQKDLEEGRLNFGGWQPRSWQPGSWAPGSWQPGEARSEGDNSD